MYKKMKTYEGGYRFINEPLIRAGIRAHTVDVDYPVSDQTLQALNHVQSVPWRINTDVFEVMKQLYVEGTEIGGIPYNDNTPLPSKTDDEWEGMDSEERREWRVRLSKIHAANAKMEAKRISFIGKMSVARLVHEEEAIWFPHFLDFRTRFYPMPGRPAPSGG